MTSSKVNLTGILLILLSFSIIVVSAFVFETAQHTVTQTIQEVATITLQNAALGNIFEGDTLRYTKVGGGGDVELASLSDTITITTSKTDVYLPLDSDLNDLTVFSIYTITNKVLAGSELNVQCSRCSLHVEYSFT